ncbi:hypothetical protein FRB99_003371, partial [Tulasnella sp. 403]
MPPKSGWKSLTRAATNPFRRSTDGSSSSRAKSKSPARKQSIEVPRSESPTPVDMPIPPAPARAAPPESVKPLPEPVPVSLSDPGAIDLTSPTQPEFGKGADQIAMGSAQKDMDVQIQQSDSAPDAPVAPPKPHIAEQSQPPDAPKEATLTVEEPTVVSAPEEPAAPPRTESAAAEQIVPDAVGQEPIAPDHLANGPPRRGEEIPITIVDEPDMTVSISSPPVNNRGTKLDIITPFQTKPAVMTPETTPQGSKTHDEDQAIGQEIYATEEILVEERHYEDIPNVNGQPRTQVTSIQNVDPFIDAKDPFIDPKVTLIPPPSRGGEGQFQRPYSIPTVRPLSHVSQTQVQVDDDEAAGLLAQAEVVTIPGSRDPLSATLNGNKHEATLDNVAHWTAYSLPSGARYYYHPDARVVTDVELEIASNLQKVCECLEQTVRPHRKGVQISQPPLGRRGNVANRLAAEEAMLDDTTAPSSSTSSDWATREHRRMRAVQKTKNQAPPLTTTYTFTADKDEGGRMVGLELWLCAISPPDTTGYGATQSSFHPVTLWVDHLAKTVSSSPPWSRMISPGAGKAVAQPEDQVLDPVLRYWEFIESHPSHTGLPAGSSEEAMEALSWCYTDLLLHPPENLSSAPFTPAECRELLDLLKTLEAQSIGPLQTHIVAKVHVRLVKHRQGQLLGLPSEGVAPKLTSEVKPREYFSNIFSRVFIFLFCFGIPWLYVPKSEPHSIPNAGAPNGLQDDTDAKPSHDGLLADSPLFAASLSLIAPVLITAGVAFLALPDLENAAQLAALISLIFSFSSFFTSFINLRRRVIDAQAAGERRALLGRPSTRSPFTQSLPLVFLVYSTIALVAAIFLYVWN